MTQIVFCGKSGGSKDNQTCLPSTSVPFNFVLHFGNEKSNRSGVSSAYDFRLT